MRPEQDSRPAARNSRSGDCKHQAAIRESLAVERPSPRAEANALRRSLGLEEV